MKINGKYLVLNIYKMSIDLRFFLRKNRDKHKFHSILKDFSKLKNKNRKPQVKTFFARYIPLENDCAKLNRANATNPNAGYHIDNSKIQEGQLFNDSDIYATDIYSDGECLYPFKFENKLLLCKKCDFS